MGRFNDYIKKLKIAKRTENELAKLEAKLDEIKEMDIEEEQKSTKILEILKETESKRKINVIVSDVRPTKYGDEYSFGEAYWKERQEVQNAIRDAREKEVAKKLESALIDTSQDFKQVYAIYEKLKMYYDKGKERNIAGITDNDFKKFKELRKFIEIHNNVLNILDPESRLDKLQTLLQISIINRINEAKTMEEQNRLFEEYIQFANDNMQFIHGKIDNVYNVVSNWEFMEKRRNIQRLKEYGIDLEFFDKVPIFYKATEENGRKTDNLNEDRAEEKMYDSISENDLVLVRSTDYFPRHRLIETLDKHTMPQKRDSYFDEELREITGNKDISKYDIFEFINRRTIHWTLNGLVGDHAYGSFSNICCIIIEPFKDHIHDEGLLSIDEADTYFAQDMKLSPNAYILMPLKRYIEMLSDTKTKKDLEEFNIAVYDGDDEIATQMLLQDLGYVYGRIEGWGFSLDRSTNAQKYCERLEETMRHISDRLKDEGKELEEETVHQYSNSYAKDLKRAYDIGTEGVERFVDFVASKCDKPLPTDAIKKVILEREELHYEKYKGIPKVDLKEVVNAIGLDKLEEITKEYNEYMLELHKEERKKKDKQNVERGLITEEALKEDEEQALI